MKKAIIFIVKIKMMIENFWHSRFMIPYYRSQFAKVGDNVWIGKNCEFICSHIEIGDDVHIGNRASFIASIAKIHIGNHVIFGPGVTIRGGDHRTDLIGKYMMDVKDDDKLPENDADVFIGDDVWVGCNVTILKGVRIGEGSVIGAGSIVTRSVPPYTVHVGCHSPYDKRRFTDDEIEEHRRKLEATKKH